MGKNVGKVVLVGAGPGDTGLLTLKGEKCIKEADCLVYDRLSSPQLLNLAKPSCELVYVGKENHKHVMRQDAINELLYEKAKAHELVVRLKGGDPYVFGRGGEEAIYLVERNVAVEVVPGVSSSVAALADAGIPITHRGVAKGFVVITAHSRKDEAADIDYSQLTDESITCVFLMSLSHVTSIATELMKAGRRPSTPVAVISNATTPGQRKCVGTLKDIGRKVEEACLLSPALTVVGDVVGLNESLDFFEQRPLFGHNFVVPYIESFDKPCGRIFKSSIGEKLSELGAWVTEVRMGRIRPLIVQDFFREVETAEWVIFTSKNGVKSFFYNIEQAGGDIRRVLDCKFAVVGKATEQALARYHIKADLVAGENTGEGLAQEILKANACGKIGKRAVIFSAKEAAPELYEELRNHMDVVKLDGYENEAATEPFHPATNEKICGVFTSASCVNRFWDVLPENAVVDRAYSIGPTTSAALISRGVNHLIEADERTYDSLIDAVLEDVLSHSGT